MGYFFPETVLPEPNGQREVDFFENEMKTDAFSQSSWWENVPGIDLFTEQFLPCKRLKAAALPCRMFTGYERGLQT